MLSTVLLRNVNSEKLLAFVWHSTSVHNCQVIKQLLSLLLSMVKVSALMIYEMRLLVYSQTFVLRQGCCSIIILILS